MRKLAIVLSSIVLLFGAGCASNSNKSDSWSTSQKVELQKGLVQGYETSGLTPSVEMTKCMTDYVVSHYSYKEVLTISEKDSLTVGEVTYNYCAKHGIVG